MHFDTFLFSFPFFFFFFFFFLFFLVLFLPQVILGTMGFFSRFGKMAFFGVMYISRLDRPLLPEGFAALDTGFLTYVGLCYFDHFYGQLNSVCMCKYLCVRVCVGGWSGLAAVHNLKKNMLCQNNAAEFYALLSLHIISHTIFSLSLFPPTHTHTHTQTHTQTHTHTHTHKHTHTHRQCGFDYLLQSDARICRHKTKDFDQPKCAVQAIRRKQPTRSITFHNIRFRQSTNGAASST